MKKQFSGAKDANLPPPNPETFVDPVSINTFFDDVKLSIATLVPVHETETAIKGNTLMMEMPEQSLFLRGEAKLRKDRLDFYALLSDILSRWGESADIHISMVQSLSEGDDTARNLAITRGGNFARFLENRGIAPELISIATNSESKPGKIILYFDVKPYTAKMKGAE